MSRLPSAFHFSTARGSGLMVLLPSGSFSNIIFANFKAFSSSVPPPLGVRVVGLGEIDICLLCFDSSTGLLGMVFPRFSCGPLNLGDVEGTFSAFDGDLSVFYLIPTTFISSCFVGVFSLNGLFDLSPVVYLEGFTNDLPKLVAAVAELVGGA